MLRIQRKMVIYSSTRNAACCGLGCLGYKAGAEAPSAARQGDVRVTRWGEAPPLMSFQWNRGPLGKAWLAQPSQDCAEHPSLAGGYRAAPSRCPSPPAPAETTLSHRFGMKAGLRFVFLPTVLPTVCPGVEAGFGLGAACLHACRGSCGMLPHRFSPPHSMRGRPRQFSKLN